jgi:cytidine deaminase
VASANGGSPCGSCRQVLSEFGLNAQVLIANRDGAILHRTTVRDLLPLAFGPDNLA